MRVSNAWPDLCSTSGSRCGICGAAPCSPLVAVASLALGIGANTAIFTLIDQLMLRLLPVQDPEQLVMIWSTGPHMGNNHGIARHRPTRCTRISSRRPRPSPRLLPVSGRRFRSASTARPSASTAELVSGNYFQALGVQPAVGRVFSPEEDDRVYKGHPVGRAQPPVLGDAASPPIPSVVGQEDPGQQLPDDDRGRFGGRLRGARPGAVPADPRSHPDEAADDARVGTSWATGAASGSRCSRA